MANTSTRMLRLLSLLQTHRYWTGSELAERLEVSERTVRRDVDRLRDLGYPVDANRGVAGGYQLEAGRRSRRSCSTMTRRSRSRSGYGRRPAGPCGGIEETSVRALTKIIRMMPPSLAPSNRRARGLHRARLARWRAERRCRRADGHRPGMPRRRAPAVRLHGSRRRHSAIRLVEPNRLVTVGRRWYLVAWDVDRADWRTFRVDRLTDPRSTRFRFQPREVPGGDAAAFVSQGLASVPTRYQVVVAIQTPAAMVERVVGGWGTVEVSRRPGVSAADERRLARLAGDGAGRRRGGVRDRRSAGASRLSSPARRVLRSRRLGQSIGSKTKTGICRSVFLWYPAYAGHTINARSPQSAFSSPPTSRAV